MKPSARVRRWLLGAGSIAVLLAGGGAVVNEEVSLSPAGWEAAGTWATFFVAVVAAGYAGPQARLAAEDRRERQRPAVVVHLTTRRGERGVYLRIANLGQTTARNVRVRLEPELDQADRIEQLLARFLSRPIGSLPAGDRLETLFGHLHSRDPSRPRVYTARVESEDYRFRPQPVETFVLDLELLAPVVQVGRKTEHHIAEGVERLSEAIERVSDSRGVHVITQSVEDMRREEEEHYEELMAELDAAEERRRELGIVRPDLDAMRDQRQSRPE